MEYAINSSKIIVDITSAKIETVIGDAAKMDCTRAINYIKSGQAEIGEAVEEGIARIDQEIVNLANTDLSNLTATGEVKFSTAETNAKNYADSLASNYATAAQGAKADTAVQPSDLATVATTGDYDDLLDKPSLATVATSGDYDDLTNKPTIPAAQVSSDWDAASGVAQILNKPSLAAVALSGAYSDLSGTPDLSVYANTDISNLTATGKSTGASLSFPSSVYDNLSWNANPNNQTAPANGWFWVDFTTSNTSQYVSTYVKDSSDNVKYSTVSWVPPSNGCGFIVPVLKGDKVTFSAGPGQLAAVNYFRFIYAQGEV